MLQLICTIPLPFLEYVQTTLSTFYSETDKIFSCYLIFLFGRKNNSKGTKRLDKQLFYCISVKESFVRFLLN